MANKRPRKTGLRPRKPSVSAHTHWGCTLPVREVDYHGDEGGLTETELAAIPEHAFERTLIHNVSLPCGQLRPCTLAIPPLES